MSKDINKSSIIGDIREKEQERYSFYKLEDLIYIVSKLMNAYEDGNYDFIGRKNGYAVVGKTGKDQEQTKRVIINTWLMNYIDLKLEYNQDDALELFGFGPSDSRFKLNLPEEQELDYIQDFADVLYEYRTNHEIKELPYEELADLIKRYLEISKDEIELRKDNKSKNPSTKK